MIEKALERLAKIETKRPGAVVGVFLILTVIFIGGFLLIKSEASFENFIPEDTPVIRSLNEIRDNLNTGTTTVIMIVQTDLSDPLAVSDVRDRDVLIALDRLRKQVEANEFVVATQSVINLVKEDGRIVEQREINQRTEDSELVSDDRSVMTMRFIVPDGLTMEQQQGVVNEIRAIMEFAETPKGIVLKLAGPIVQDQEVNGSIGSSIGFVTMLGFVGVFIVLYIIFRKVTMVGVAVIPIIFGTLWTNGTLGYIGIPFSTALVGVFSMIIGIGIDFAIHIIHRFEEEIKRSPLEEAVTKAVKNVGKGLTLTTITTVIGFLALLSATLPVLKDMAIALSFGVIYSLIAAIGLIPPLLVILHRRDRPDEPI